MNLLLFLIVIGASFIVVRVGAVAFQLTGLEWSLAKFQALSCFTGTGFTTRESELITASPQRRRIASILIILGHAGLVTLIATFANSLRPSTLLPQFTIPFLHLVFPSYLLPWINLTIIIIAVYTIYKVLLHSRPGKGFTTFVQRKIISKKVINPVSFEELMVATGGYGVSQIDVCKMSPVLDKTLLEADLRRRGVTVLVIERNGQVFPNPLADTRIMLGDRLICFGKLQDIRDSVCVVQGPSA
ncbi:MAG: TrkA C-terminal domain-containing protein [Candidatus Omnitrophica bacterium]|nr:TrkA C-terminal domain-containing protein [Candidatus Omnitrophota bacterium]MDD5429512.1 TrkA C-terminal domain-containing protein [Candidatus Omnitrophota bacterium]